MLTRRPAKKWIAQALSGVGDLPGEGSPRIAPSETNMGEDRSRSAEPVKRRAAN